MFVSQVFYGKGPPYIVFHGSSLVESENLAKDWVDSWRKKYFRISREEAILTVETFNLANLELVKVLLCKNLQQIDTPLEWQEDLLN